MGFLKLFDAVAEKIILDAMDNGEFDDLPGKGRPFEFEDDSMVPADLRMGFKILKNSGHLPPEIEQEREIRHAKDLLADCKDERERYRQIQKLNYMVLKLNMTRKKPIYLEKSQYYDKVVERTRIEPAKDPDAAPGTPVAACGRSSRDSRGLINDSGKVMPPEKTRRSFRSLGSWFRRAWDRMYA